MMAYTAPTITDRIAVGDNKFKFKIDGDIITLEPYPDSVTEPGTDINKALLQPLVDAVATHGVEIYTNIPQAMTEIDAGLLKNSKGFETKALGASDIKAGNYSNPGYTDVAIPYDRYILFVNSSCYAESNYTNNMTRQIRTAFLICTKKNATGIGIVSNSAAIDKYYTYSNTAVSLYYGSTDNYSSVSLTLQFSENGVRLEYKSDSGITFNTLNVNLTYMQI